jgi:hypothetical protein
MPALALASPDDPRLDALVASTLKSMRIDRDWAPTIRQLATGELPGSTLVCCGSKCRPCTKELQKAVVRVLTRLHNPEPPSRTGLHIRSRGRGLMRKLRGGS